MAASVPNLCRKVQTGVQLRWDGNTHTQGQLCIRLSLNEDLSCGQSTYGRYNTTHLEHSRCSCLPHTTKRRRHWHFFVIIDSPISAKINSSRDTTARSTHPFTVGTNGLLSYSGDVGDAVKQAFSSKARQGLETALVWLIEEPPASRKTDVLTSSVAVASLPPTQFRRR